MMNKQKSLAGAIFPISLIAIIPVIIIVTGLILRHANQEFSLFAIDPEFSYLFSGILLGQGKIFLFIDHPGTPLIVIAAVVSRIVHLFRPSLPYAEDVMLNSDIYLNAMNISLIILIALIVLVTGFWVYRKSGNLPAAVFIQFYPFVIEYVFSSLERYMPEPFFIAVIVFLSGFMVIDIYDALKPDQRFWNRSVIYGLIVGFGISLKFTFAPFLIAPIFLLQGLKRKVYYLAASIISFLVFTFPLLKRGKTFYEWISSIILHSGKYGSGDATVIDPSQFFTNLKTILYSEKHLVLALVMALLTLILSLIPSFRKRIRNKKYLMALTGITLTLIAGILAISKHFAAYYLIPYSLLTVFIVYLAVNVILESCASRIRWIEVALYAGIAILMLINPKNLHQHRLNLEARKNDHTEKMR